MPGIEIVAARSTNNVIGRGLEIPWRAKGEQKLFKDITMGGALIMGRKTFETIGRPLPGRAMVIVRRRSRVPFGTTTGANGAPAASSSSASKNAISCSPDASMRNAKR